VGFGLGSYNTGSGGPITGNSYTLYGPSIGAQAGAVYQQYFAAARFEYQLLNNPTPSQGASPKDVLAGVLIGYTLSSAPVRFWAGFNFVDNLNAGGQTLSSDSFLVGGGYFLGRVSINVDLHFRSFAVYNVLGQGIQPSYFNGVVSVSLPLTFGIPPMQDLARRNRSTQKDAGSTFGDWNI